MSRRDIPRTDELLADPALVTTTDGGATVAWTTAVKQFHFPHMLHLAIGGGASGYILYEVQRSGGGTIASVRASSEQDLFGFDLAKLKNLVER